MSGPYTSFTRSNADYPIPYRVGSYWPHSSGLCHHARWSPSTSFQGAPVAVFVHGGRLGNNPGWGAMSTDLFATDSKWLALATRLSAAGWVVVSIDYPVASFFRHQVLPDGDEGSARILGSYEEQWPIALWPEQPTYIAMAVQQIKSNWSAIEGDLSGPLSAEWLGSGNSINPNKVFVMADDWGATCAMYAFLQPSGAYPYEPQLAHLSMDRFTPRASHRVAGLVLRNPGPIDFTQFHVLTGYGQPDSIPSYLRNDRFHPMMRAESHRRWSTIPQQLKFQSPWWVLQETHHENAAMVVYADFEQNGTGESSGYDSSLGDGDWDPGVLLDTAPNQWLLPSDGRVQATALRSALSLFGAPETNSATPIRNSIVRDAVAGSSYPTISDPEDWVDEVATLLQLAGTDV